MEEVGFIIKYTHLYPLNVTPWPQAHPEKFKYLIDKSLETGMIGYDYESDEILPDGLRKIVMIQYWSDEPTHILSANQIVKTVDHRFKLKWFQDNNVKVTYEFINV